MRVEDPAFGEIAAAISDETLSPRRAAQILRVSPRDTGASTLEALAVKNPKKAGNALRFVPEAAGFVKVALGLVGLDGSALGGMYGGHDCVFSLCTGYSNHL